MDESKPVNLTSNHAKINEADAVGDTDSFDEMKFDPINMEPVFSTAAGVRIEVSDASLEKTKQLFQKDQKPKAFSSPAIRGGKPGGFISPFRSEETRPKVSTPVALSISLKRPQETKTEDDDDDFPPPTSSKRSKTTGETPRASPETAEPSEFTGKVVRVENVPECSETRLVLQTFPNASKILVRFRKGLEKIGLFDQIRVKTSLILKKNQKMEVEEIAVKEIEILEKSTAKTEEEHSFAIRPFIREPCYIHDLEATGDENELQFAILKVNIVDFGPKQYNGCPSCKYRYAQSTKKNPDTDKLVCPVCDVETGRKKCIFSLMKVVDFSGQMEIFVGHEVMKAFLATMGYREVRELDKFCNLQEQINCIFKPIMVRLRRKEVGSDEWEALEFAEVDWEGYEDAIGERLKREEQIEASGLEISNGNGSTDVDEEMKS